MPSYLREVASLLHMDYLHSNSTALGLYQRAGPKPNGRLRPRTRPPSPRGAYLTLKTTFTVRAAAA